MEIVHIANIIAEWNQQVAYAQGTTLRGRYEREATTSRARLSFRSIRGSAVQANPRLSNFIPVICTQAFANPGPERWNSGMNAPRRGLLQSMLTAATASFGRSQSKAET
jgi:hypothetical protein